MSKFSSDWINFSVILTSSPKNMIGFNVIILWDLDFFSPTEWLFFLLKIRGKVSEFSDLRITYPSLLVENSCPELDIISTSDNGFFEILLITNNVSVLFIGSWEISLLRNSIKNKIPNLWDWGCWIIDEIILHLLSRRVCRYGSIWLS